MITVKLDSKVFVARKETLEQSDFFKGLLELNDNELVIDRDPKAFKHILAYLRNNKYRIPTKYIYEIDFYSFDYPCYTHDSKDFVDVYAENTLFRLRADFLINKSEYFKTELSKMYVGTPCYLDTPESAFKHVLRRLIDASCVNDMKYRKYVNYYKPIEPFRYYADVKVKCSDGTICITGRDMYEIWNRTDSPWKEEYKGRIPYTKEQVEYAISYMNSSYYNNPDEDYREVCDFLDVTK